MKVIDDKDVGELWVRRLAELEAAWPDRKGAEAFEMDIVIGLICKLVEERKQLMRWRHNECFEDHTSDVLRELGIDPATYPGREMIDPQPIADYFRRIDLAIKGVARGENVSTWVMSEHLKESKNFILDAEAGRRMAEHIPDCLRCYTGEEQYKCERHTWTLAEWRAELERELQ